MLDEEQETSGILDQIQTWLRIYYDRLLRKEGNVFNYIYTYNNMIIIIMIIII
jgi:rRNA pseudouridine-1189 N-methylase Emg1 (Nep1/Mra1 family)